MHSSYKNSESLDTNEITDEANVYSEYACNVTISKIWLSSLNTPTQMEKISKVYIASTFVCPGAVLDQKTTLLFIYLFIHRSSLVNFPIIPINSHHTILSRII